MWNKNKYGNVFQKLSTVPVGEDITVLWNSQLYTYQIDHKVIKRPKDVAKEISAWQDKEYLTLMACYPLFSDAQRILVRGTLVPKKTGLLSMHGASSIN
jgi:LPXTG-site transpeptidase (sortase) family protein